MGLLSLLGGAKAATKIGTNIVKGAMNAADALHFSAEEKVTYILEVSKLAIQHAKQTIGESSIRSMTRRALAIMFCGTFLYFLIFAAMAWRWNPKWALHVFECAKVLQNPVIAIILFFFGSYGVGYFFDKKNKNK